MFKLQRRGIQNTQVAVYISDTTVTLEQSPGHQTYNDNVDPKQGYNHATFERYCFTGVLEKANVKDFFFQMRKCVIISLEHARTSKKRKKKRKKKSGIFVIYLT